MVVVRRSSWFLGLPRLSTKNVSPSVTRLVQKIYRSSSRRTPTAQVQLVARGGQVDQTGPPASYKYPLTENFLKIYFREGTFLKGVLCTMRVGWVVCVGVVCWFWRPTLPPQKTSRRQSPVSSKKYTAPAAAQRPPRRCSSSPAGGKASGEGPPLLINTPLPKIS